MKKILLLAIIAVAMVSCEKKSERVNNDKYAEYKKDIESLCGLIGHDEKSAKDYLESIGAVEKRLEHYEYYDYLVAKQGDIPDELIDLVIEYGIVQSVTLTVIPLNTEDRKGLSIAAKNVLIKDFGKNQKAYYYNDACDVYPDNRTYFNPDNFNSEVTEHLETVLRAEHNQYKREMIVADEVRFSIDNPFDCNTWEILKRDVYVFVSSTEK